MLEIFNCAGFKSSYREELMKKDIKQAKINLGYV